MILKWGEFYTNGSLLSAIYIRRKTGHWVSAFLASFGGSYFSEYSAQQSQLILQLERPYCLYVPLINVTPGTRSYPAPSRRRWVQVTPSLPSECHSTKRLEYSKLWNSTIDQRPFRNEIPSLSPYNNAQRRK